MSLPDTYFSCTDPEDLEHTTVEAAVEAYLDGFMVPDCDATVAIRDHSPVTVTEYRRATIEGSWITGLALRLLDRAADEIFDEFSRETELDINAAEPEMFAAVRRLCADVKPWRCDPVGKRTLDAAEVERMLRAHRPDWFEDAK